MQTLYLIEQTILDGFRINHQIGQGSYGVVYCAESTVDSSDVAIKFTYDRVNFEAEKKSLREIQATQERMKLQGETLKHEVNKLHASGQVLI
jgi:serine/threonine protein kinase